MQFSLGKPILVLLVLAAISGVAIRTRGGAPRTDLVVWCFADSHAHTYRDPLPLPDGSLGPSLIDQFKKSTGLCARVDLIGQQAEDVRLISLFMSSTLGDQVPDLCEIELKSIGKFLRPGTDEIGLLPLNDFLKSSGQYDRILSSRFSPWSKIDPRTGERIIFGIPNDVHPVTLTYRKDLFDEAGIDLQQAKTWPQFQDMCLAFQKYRAEHGHPESHAMELFTSQYDNLMVLLVQRHINIVDSADRVHLAEGKVADTVAFYAQMVAGPRAIGTNTEPTPLYAGDLARGHVCAMLTPDWRAVYFPQFAPELAGKLRMMPLPKFDDTDAPTSTWGGTMMGIPRASKHPREAWKLLELLYLSPQGNAARLATDNNQVLPPIPELWSDPVYHQPDPFYGGQKVGELYVQLAEQIPDRESSPFSDEGAIALAQVQQRAEEYVATHGTSGLHDACAKWLLEAQQMLQERIDFFKFKS